MLKKHWVVREVNPEHQQALARALAISPITASVLLGRGVGTTEQARQWLASDLSLQHDPFLVPDMEVAVDRLRRAIRTGDLICVYGDYDVDGVSATSLFLSFFRDLGANIIDYIPHRLQEGYGLNVQALQTLAGQGVKLLVTADCGSTSFQEIDAANQLGMQVIVTDHHQVGDRLPQALALLNPHRVDSSYPFPGLCSGGLAYKVAQAYRTKFGGGTGSLEGLLDLVALATVADVVPLRDENRGFVRAGLALIEGGSRCGIRALKQAAGVTGPCTGGTVAFRLAPRINAAGRLDQARAAVRLLITDSDQEAGVIAERLEQLNRDRQRIEEEVASEAMASMNEEALPPGIVLWSRQWHLGVVGIVASRLVERFHRPAVVVAVDGRGNGKGSARSVPGFNLYEALSRCRAVLDGFGGHPAAAGLTIQESHLPELRARFAEVAAEWSGEQPAGPMLHVDAEVALREVDYRLVRELEQLKPFGAGNPEPTLAVRNLAIVTTRVVGDNHLKLTVRHENSAPFDGIGFRMGSLADRGLVQGTPVDAVFVPEMNRWNGLDRIQLRIRDLKASQGS